MNIALRFASVAVVVTVAGAIAYTILDPARVPATVGGPALAEIVVTEVTVPSGLTVHRTVRGSEALRASRVMPADVNGFVDAIETSFDRDEEHGGDHEDLYVTFAAAFNTVADAEQAFDAAVAWHESPAGWDLTSKRARDEPDPDLGLGEASVHYAQGSDFGYPEIKVYLWRVENVVLHAVDFHPYDRPDLLESIVRGMSARATVAGER